MDGAGKGETSGIHEQQPRLVGKPGCWVKEEERERRWSKAMSILVVMMGGQAFVRGQVHTCSDSDH